jgi:hypothetical protein
MSTDDGCSIRVTGRVDFGALDQVKSWMREAIPTRLNGLAENVEPYPRDAGGHTERGGSA